MRLTITERARLARQDILVCAEYGDGLCKCRRRNGHDYWYLAEDLRQLAKPGWVESMRHWLMEVAA